MNFTSKNDVEIDPSELHYSIGSKEIELQDGQLIIPETDKEDLTLKVEYTDDTNQVYSEIIKVQSFSLRMGISSGIPMKMEI